MIVKVATKSKRPGWLKKRLPFYLAECSCGLQFFAGSAMSPPVINPIFRSDDCFSNRCVSLCSTLFLQEKNTIFKVVS
ncbi:hypothetical protein JG559_05720 [Enterococcus faecalis]|uniref:Uncharacterized protein n=1 Tax=Enterococcus faecalis TaxID=1351 RepID=A0A974S685_ENTFL|nr:hypothetical protein JG559_05720 [Enterococcus faecalis]